MNDQKRFKEAIISTPSSISKWVGTFLGFAIFFFIATSLWAWISHKDIGEAPPPWNIDGIFYDNLGFNIHHGDGMTADFRAQPWRQTYEELNQERRYQWVMTIEGSGPTTMRSPGYPAFLASHYNLFGWRWDAARIGGLLIASLGLSLVMTWCWFGFGPTAAVIAAATLVADYSVMQSASMIASEPLALFFLMVFLVILLRAYESPSLVNWGIAGVVFGLMMLTRGNWNLWFLLMITASILFLSPSVRNVLSPVGLKHVLVFLLVSASVALPWWIRNCQMTGQFQPFGTAGANGLVGAYCDASLNDFGNWQNQMYQQNQLEVRSIANTSGITLAEREYLTGKSSTKKAFTWVGGNWHQLPKLGLYRLLSHWGLTNPTVPLVAQIGNITLVLLGLLGCFSLRGRARHVVIFILLVDTMGVMLTWAHVGRYAIPLRPLVHVGLATLLAGLIGWFKTSHSEKALNHKKGCQKRVRRNR